MTRERIDKLLVDKGFADSRNKAQAMVMAGVVLADEKRVSKPSESYPPETTIRIKGDSPENKYVGRGGLKLEKALSSFSIDPTGLVCLDIGSSTGGFTDCLLKHGAARVVAVDVGTNQLVWSLRDDPRVEVRENTNARNLKPGDFQESFDLAVMDVSFISATKIMPAVTALLKPGGKLIILIKPQFEVGRGEVGKGGIVRDAEKHERVIDGIDAFAVSIGLEPGGVVESPILGAEGNKEFLALYMWSGESMREKDAAPKPLVEGLDFYLEDGLMVLTSRYLLKRGYCCESGCRHCPYGYRERNNV
ncbi:MAG: TlyA family rRNA (cytidine-2'-O)-methyltransferase [Pyrinomonadaceae bacterium]